MNRFRLIRALMLIYVPFAALVSAATAGPTASADKITLARPTASAEIMAEPSKVWKKLVSAEGMNAFGVTLEKKKNLEKVGDNLRANVAGDAGNIVVTHIAKESDWRAAFEPERGNYICSIRFELKAQGNNTLLVYSDWYSDEKPDTIEQTLKDTEKSMVESLARFKGLVEKTSASGNR